VKRPRITVIGIGNVLLGDDGFGPTVIELLAAGWEMPEEVELVDAGTPGLDLAHRLVGRETVFLVDAVNTRGTPGTVRTYQGEQLRELPLWVRVSPHDPSLQEALLLAELCDRKPASVTLFGAVPASTEVGTGRSPALRQSAEFVAELVAVEIEAALACRLTRREGTAPEAWWLTAPTAPAVQP
jgi:hydrogenase maturation protease